MKQLLILSGKGGTGKTTVAGSFIDIGNIKAFADCDVDAPNLHIIATKKEPSKTDDFVGLKKAEIDENKCLKCGICEKMCKFDAIKDCKIRFYDCEGCGLCARVCPAQAIKMIDPPSGKLMLYNDDDSVFSTAKLNMGSGASGKLVAAVKKQLENEADNDIAIVDGSPGIGCPVIASISGAYFVLIIAEPTVSGIHDMKRIIETTNHFGVNCAVCINKYNVNEKLSDDIVSYCNSINIDIAGKIPYDKTVVTALNEGKGIAKYPESPAALAIKDIWTKIYNNYLN